METCITQARRRDGDQGRGLGVDGAWCVCFSEAFEYARANDRGQSLAPEWQFSRHSRVSQRSVASRAGGFRFMRKAAWTSGQICTIFKTLGSLSISVLARIDRRANVACPWLKRQGCFSTWMRYLATELGPAGPVNNLRLSTHTSCTHSTTTTRRPVALSCTERSRNRTPAFPPSFTFPVHSFSDWHQAMQQDL